MKKYKLIKEYPESPKMGSIATISEVYNNDMTCTYKIGDFTYYGVHHPKHYPEFWEEVKERGYEVLQYYQDTSNGGKYYYDKGNLNWEYIYQFIEKGIYKISKVKRLSDGEIFTIGDKLVLDKWMEGRKYITIDEIYFNEHKQLSFRTNIKPAPCTFVFGLCDINSKKYKEPLFVTEDGVEIYDKFEVFYKVIIPSMLYRTTQYSVEGDRVREQSDCKYFSTKETAKKWIDNNKPIYSKEDISYALDKCTAMKAMSRNEFEHILGI